VTFELGLVIGKFYPPHRGHQFLIESALAASRRVIVILCERVTDTIPGPTRAAWLRELVPGAEVMVVDDRYDEQDSRIWAENTLRWLGRAPDAVFTSEDYGEPYAALMGSTHVSVDRAREKLPVSGTAIRADPFAHWDFISAPLRGYFARRVCVLGAESTGTTTLARALSERLDTVWVREYGREYSARKLERGESSWQSAEFTHIALEQTRLEDEAARKANRLVIADTNAFATRLWHRRYLGGESADVRAVAAAVKCDLYLLTGDEVPFEQDGLRDGEQVRHAMHAWFVEELESQGTPWKLLRGPHAARMALALDAVNSLFHDSAWRPQRSIAGQSKA
jgi:HTH-type transcriptional repressor of NAD biosynthesis genes